jgi:hypothetical protein
MQHVRHHYEPADGVRAIVTGRRGKALEKTAPGRENFATIRCVRDARGRGAAG